MTDNSKHAEGVSRRRKIIQEFEINLGRCILCGICVDVCNFDAIEMSHEHELSKYERNGNRVDLPRLLDMGRAYQRETEWSPSQPKKNSGVPVDKPARDEKKGCRGPHLHHSVGDCSPSPARGWGEQMITPVVVLFYVAAALTIGGGLVVVMTRNIVYAALALLVSLMGVAGVFLIAFAEFLALVQVLIYGGAIIIVFLFALMLTRIEDFSRPNRS